MFICVSRNNEQQKISRAIQRSLEIERQKNKSRYKVLLLGASECGKSTFIKQAKIIYLSGFTEAERSYYVQMIRQNILNALHTIRNGSSNLDIPFSNAAMKIGFTEVLEKVDFQNDKGLIPMATPSVQEFFKSLMQDKGVQSIIKRKSDIGLMDSAEFFLSNYPRICNSKYLPTDEDILLARVATSGVQETTFLFGTTELTYVDVGGRRTERRKWVHCFENMNAILFVASLSEYDQKLGEDQETWRTQESLDLFDKILQSRWFLHIPIILFLNKSDIFKSKMAYIPIKSFFPDYEGGDDYDKGIKFFRNLYKDKIDKSKREFFVHTTCATDSTSCKFVFSAINNVIVKRGIKNMGFE